MESKKNFSLKKEEGTPYAFLVMANREEVLKVYVKTKIVITEKKPVPRKSDDDPIEYKNKDVVKEVENVLMIAANVNYVDYLGQKNIKYTYTTPLIQINNLVDANCDNGVVYFLYL